MTSMGLSPPGFAAQVMEAVTPHVSVETWAEFSSRLPSLQVTGTLPAAGCCSGAGWSALAVPVRQQAALMGPMEPHVAAPTASRLTRANTWPAAHHQAFSPRTLQP